MTKQIISFTLLLLTGIFSLQAADSKPIRIGTNDIDLILKIGDNGRLYQSYLGERLQSEADIAFLKQGKEVYLTHGLEDYFEPAIRVLHNDGNPSLLLKYVSHENRKIDDNVTETVITLQNKAGQTIPERTEWIPVVAWRGLAETIEKYTHKGSKLYIEGRFTTRKYETNDGQKRTVSEIVAESIEMLDPKRDAPPLPPEPEQKLSYNP